MRKSEPTNKHLSTDEILNVAKQTQFNEANLQAQGEIDE
jgi:hypothetical protein